MSNLLSRLETRKMPFEDVRICLDLNLLGARDEAIAAVARAVRQSASSDARMAGVGASQNEAQQRLAELEAEIRDASITLRITGVDRKEYNAWMMACPPRKGKVGESYNPTIFFMLAAKNSATYVDEAGVAHEITPEEWKHIDDTVTDGEHDRLAQAVINVNRTAGAQSIDFLDSGSATTRDSFGISASPSSSGSRPAGSGVGSRKKSTAKAPTKTATKS